MLMALETIMEIIAALLIVGVAIYKVVDAIIYLKYREEHKDEDI